MQSDNVANSAINPVSNPGTIVPPGVQETPLDFITKNIRKAKESTPPAPTTPNVTTAEQVSQKVETPPTEKVEVKTETPVKEGEVDFTPSVVEASSKEPIQTSTPVEPDFESEVEIAPEAQNFKKLRTKYKETSKTLKERETEAEGLRTRIKKYEAGEEEPEYVSAMKKRLGELEPLEQLHKFRTSEAYKTSIVEPLAEATTSLVSLAKEYNIPESVIEEVINEYDNERDINQFLSNNFDSIGGLEAKQKIVAIQKLKKEAAQAETKPGEALAVMEENSRQVLAIKDAQRKNTIAAVSKSGWNSAFQKIVEAGEIEAIIPRENDPEFNEKYAYAIQKTAAQNYGRIIRELADAGLKELPPHVSEALATSTILAITSAIAEKRAKAAEDYAAEIQRNSDRSGRYSRPNLGASGGGGSPLSSQKGPVSTYDAATSLINQIVTRK